MPGLCTEAVSLEALLAVVVDLVPDLLVANGMALRGRGPDPAGGRADDRGAPRRLMADLYRRLVRLLRESECELRRQAKRSHEVWHSPVSQCTFTVPANITSQRLANEVLKQAGLTKAF